MEKHTLKLMDAQAAMVALDQLEMFQSVTAIRLVSTRSSVTRHRISLRLVKR
jgi:hypothetical protein